MSYEIEKRFLLSGLPKFPATTRGPFTYTHGFLPGTTIKERVTMRPGSYDGERGPTFKRTVKVGKGERRFEFAENIDKATYDRFWPLTEGHRILAQRWKVPERVALYDVDLDWEITEFLVPTTKGEGLVLCEIELPELNVSVTHPPWLAEVVVRDVTDDESYENFHLACIS